ILPLAFMAIDSRPFRNELTEEGFEIGPDIGIAILLNEERGRCVPAEDREEPRDDILPADPFGDRSRDLDEAAPARRNGEPMQELAHDARQHAVAARPRQA